MSHLERYIDAEKLNVLLIRHAQPGPGDEIEGLKGRPLTPLGREQAALMAKRVSRLHLDHIYSSDMARAYQTAEPLRQRCPDVPYTRTEDIREVSGFHMSPTESPETEEDIVKAAEQKARTERFAAALPKQHTLGETVAVVAHGNLNRLLLSQLLGLAPTQVHHWATYHTSVALVQIDAENQAALRLFNCTLHLPEEMVATPNLR